ncbi:hypothetical protein JUNP479_1170 [Aeromonas jandaei]|nr:hypothetical protein JUNP479_1170 [Aeromonas jandaei]
MLIQRKKEGSRVTQFPIKPCKTVLGSVNDEKVLPARHIMLSDDGDGPFIDGDQRQVLVRSLDFALR